MGYTILQATVAIAASTRGLKDLVPPGTPNRSGRRGGLDLVERSMAQERERHVEPVRGDRAQHRVGVHRGAAEARQLLAHAGRQVERREEPGAQATAPAVSPPASVSPSASRRTRCRATRSE